MVVHTKSIIDITNTEALLVRSNDDGGDVFIVDTVNSQVRLPSGVLNISDTTAPTPTTNQLYSVSGGLYWNGTQLDDGVTSSSSSIGILDGTVSSPTGLYFSSDGDTGLYRVGENNMGFTTGGVSTLQTKYNPTKTLPFTDANIVLRLDFNDSSNLGDDISGNAYDLSNVGGGPNYLTSDTDNINKTLYNVAEFSGSTALELTGITNGGVGDLIYDTFNSSGFSLSFWIRADTFATSQTLFEVSDGTLTNNRITFYHDTSDFRFECRNPAGSIYLNYTLDGSGISTGEWVHIAVVMSTVFSVFLNGRFVGRSVTAYQSIQITELNIAQRSDATIRFNGRMKNVILSSSIWSQTQVQQLYQYQHQIAQTLAPDFYGFIGDDDTGITRETDNTLSFVRGGTERIKIDDLVRVQQFDSANIMSFEGNSTNPFASGIQFRTITNARGAGLYFTHDPEYDDLTKAYIGTPYNGEGTSQKLVIKTTTLGEGGGDWASIFTPTWNETSTRFTMNYNNGYAFFGNGGVTPTSRVHIRDDSGLLVEDSSGGDVLFVDGSPHQVTVTGNSGSLFNVRSTLSNLVFNINSTTEDQGVVSVTSDSVNAFVVEKSDLSNVFVVNNSANPQATIVSGTSSVPSYSFITDPDTGMYLAGAGDLGFSTGGIDQLRITNTEATFYSDTNVVNSVPLAFFKTLSSNNASGGMVGGYRIETYPARSGGIIFLHTGDSNRGFFIGNRYNGGSGVNLLTFQGSTSGFVNPGSSSNGLDIMSIQYDSTPQVYFADGDVSNPIISFLNDTNTGLYRLEQDNIAFTTGAVKRMNISSTGHNVEVPTNITVTNTEAFVVENTGGDNVLIVDTTNNQVQFPNGILDISDTTEPAPTTNKLYAVSGGLYWNGSQLDDGITSSSSSLGILDGTVSSPTGLYFSADEGGDTGLYRIEEDNIGFTTNGVKRMNISSTGHNIEVQTNITVTDIEAFVVESATGIDVFIVDSTNGKTTVGFGSENTTTSFHNDGDTLLTLGLDNPWSFKQNGVDASAFLELNSNIDGKNFLITSANGTNNVEFGVSNTLASSYLDIFGTSASTSKDTGALRVEGGAGFGDDCFIEDGNLTIHDTNTIAFVVEDTDGNDTFVVDTSTPQTKIREGGLTLFGGRTNASVRPAFTLSDSPIQGEIRLTEGGGDHGFLRIGAGGGTSTENYTGIEFSGFHTDSSDMEDSMVLYAGSVPVQRYSGLQNTKAKHITYSQRSTGSGTFSTTGTSVTGVGTAFDTELIVGDYLYSSNESRIIASITNATTMTIESAFEVDKSSETVYYVRPTMEVADDVKVYGDFQTFVRGTTNISLLDVSRSTNDPVLTVGSGSATNTTLRFTSSSTSKQYIYFDSSAGTDEGRIQYDHSGPYMQIYAEGGEKIRIEATNTTFYDSVSIVNATAATSVTSGALKVTGGISTQNALWAGQTSYIYSDSSNGDRYLRVWCRNADSDNGYAGVQLGGKDAGGGVPDTCWYMVADGQAEQFNVPFTIGFGGGQWATSGTDDYIYMQSHGSESLKYIQMNKPTFIDSSTTTALQVRKAGDTGDVLTVNTSDTNPKIDIADVSPSADGNPILRVNNTCIYSQYTTGLSSSGNTKWTWTCTVGSETSGSWRECNIEFIASGCQNDGTQHGIRRLSGSLRKITGSSGVWGLTTLENINSGSPPTITIDTTTSYTNTFVVDFDAPAGITTNGYQLNVELRMSGLLYLTTVTTSLS